MGNILAALGNILTSKTMLSALGIAAVNTITHVPVDVTTSALDVSSDPVNIAAGVVMILRIALAMWETRQGLRK